ncbi:MAG: RloB domain-containing protein [Planctomycetes bacterium]|nr:RloB domain-containing protein [Planctomycetota bacterium]
MGGPASIRHKLSRGVPRRARSPRPIKRTILIVGEGRETEPNYFDGLKREDAVSARFAVTVIKGPGFSPEQVLDVALNRMNVARRRGEDFDEVWCVVDVEGLGRHDSLRKMRQSARNADIQLCLSNPSFEVWLLSHFVRIAKSYNGSDAVAADLTKHWQACFGQEYQKNDERVYERLAARTPTAIQNARWVREKHHRGKPDMLDCNSSTEVYLLVGHLTGLW